MAPIARPNDEVDSFEHEAALAVVSRFPVADAGIRIEPVPHAKGFSGAIILRVTQQVSDSPDIVTHGEGASVLCLRGWPPAGLPQPRLRELHRFLRFLHGQQVHVLPVPLNDVRGRSLVPQLGRFWQLEPWMPGVADFSQSPTEARLRSAMHVLATVHQAAAHYVPTASGREWFTEAQLGRSPAVGERLKLLQTWMRRRMEYASQFIARDGDPRFAAVARDLIEALRVEGASLTRELVKMSTIAVPLQVCLRDVWHDHLLFTGDEVTGLVDPSAARLESVAADLSRLLGSLLGRWNERWDEALAMYQEVSGLSMTELRLVRILHRSGSLLSGLMWIERRMDDAIREHVLPRVISRMEAFRDQIVGT